MAYEKKLIEGNFPCQQVGAESQRELAVGKQPPVQRLHVWWARRPLTPSRAAVLGSILPADVHPDVFLKDLGIVKKQAIIGQGSRMNRKQDFLKVVVIIAATSATSGDRELIIHALQDI